MGAFNTVRANVECSNCHREVEKAIQFKYGNRYQFTYAIGDRIGWGGNDTGQPGVRRVRVRSIAEACPECGVNGEEYYDVIIERDVITAVSYLPEYRDYFYVIEEE